MSSDFAAKAARPLTGAEYLESIRDGREIWIYGERVKDVTAHPAFRTQRSWQVEHVTRTRLGPGEITFYDRSDRPRNEQGHRATTARVLQPSTRPA